MDSSISTHKWHCWSMMVHTHTHTQRLFGQLFSWTRLSSKFWFKSNFIILCERARELQLESCDKRNRIRFRVSVRRRLLLQCCRAYHSTTRFVVCCCVHWLVQFCYSGLSGQTSYHEESETTWFQASFIRYSLFSFLFL